MTPQETFNTVVTHLRKQGRKAVNASRHCLYRTEDGLKCAAGCLIPDADYNPAFEGLLVFTTGTNLIKSYLEGLGHDLELVGKLQKIHDMLHPLVWETALKNLADTRGLVFEEKT